MKKFALITGGTRGIGLGIARSLAIDGADIAVNGVRDESAVAEVLDELRLIGGRVLYCQGNIANEPERQSVVNKALAEFGRIDLLVNNAGVAPLHRTDILETTMESYDRVMDINLRGSFFMTQAVANHMILSRENNIKTPRCIINISSVSATMPSINRGEYCISKAGMSMMTSLFASKLAPYEIQVFEIRPGLISTDMTSRAKEEYDRRIKEGLIPQGRWGVPEDVGKVVASMANGQLPYSTGQVVMVDGGLSIPKL